VEYFLRPQVIRKYHTILLLPVGISYSAICLFYAILTLLVFLAGLSATATVRRDSPLGAAASVARSSGTSTTASSLQVSEHGTSTARPAEPVVARWTVTLDSHGRPNPARASIKFPTSVCSYKAVLCSYLLLTLWLSLSILAAPHQQCGW
jgi:hypothetical protein